MLRVVFTLSLLSGCFLSHRVESEGRRDGGPGDGGRIDAARVDASIDAGECIAAERFVSVSIVGDPGCALGSYSIFPSGVAMDGLGELVLEGQMFDEPIGMSIFCQIHLSGLSAEVSDAFFERMTRIADAYVELAPTHFLLRDTSLCDGPPREECPLVLEAESGRVRPREEFGRVSVGWGETTCTGDCGSLRALEFAFSLGERVDRAVLRQGEVNRESRAATRFANMRSFNSCTDEGDTITWAFWIP